MSLGDLWIVVPNWDEFQHYKDRRPPWIRVYTELAHRDEYLDLPPAARGLLLDIWIAFALSNGQTRVRHVMQTMHTRHRGKVQTKHFEALTHAGLLVLSASRPVPQRQRQRQISRVVTSEVDVANGNNSGKFQIPEDLFRDVPR